MGELKRQVLVALYGTIDHFARQIGVPHDHYSAANPELGVMVNSETFFRVSRENAVLVGSKSSPGWGYEEVMVACGWFLEAHLALEAGDNVAADEATRNCLDALVRICVKIGDSGKLVERIFAERMKSG